MQKTTMRIASIAAVAAVALAACSSSKSSSSSSSSAAGTTPSGGGQTVKIGFFGALTGPNSPQLGINEYNGVKLAVDQYNAKSPATKVDLIKYDSQGDPTQASTLAQKVISDHTIAVIGPAFSGESKTANPIFEAAQIVNVTASATATSLGKNGWKYWHRAVGNDNSQAPAAAKYIAKKLKSTKVAVIDDNSEYGLGIADIVRTSLPTFGSTVAVSDHIDPKASDYSATVTKVKASGATAIFFGGYYAQAGPLLKQLRDGNVTAKFVSDDGSDDPKLVSTAGATAAEGAVITCPCGDITKNPAAASFVSDYKTSSGADPGTYSAEAFDAANLVLQGIAASYTTGSGLNTYLSTADYKGLANELKFDATNQIVSPTIYAYSVKSGTLSYDGPVDQLVGG
jgi:branched-chain amino acid transport system substrate-binding protein